MKIRSQNYRDSIYESWLKCIPPQSTCSGVQGKKTWQEIASLEIPIIWSHYTSISQYCHESYVCSNKSRNTEWMSLNNGALNLLSQKWRHSNQWKHTARTGKVNNLCVLQLPDAMCNSIPVLRINQNSHLAEAPPQLHWSYLEQST